ncbi:hypothetical protein QQF64_032308 [Cirrhinus molitorella]|uniref:Uncharacterized protein n=2 Tax=Cirrhinus molitorella TaxID=172907 RepID=A0AA88Q0B6_9TELE|nr:hypothetical protein Q8A67_009885 [Cirrhinus molitorella]
MDLDKNNKSLEEEFFKDYKPAENDLLTLPKHVIYLLLAISVTGVTLFAIIRHLIQDLIHDLADFLFGEQPVEEPENLWERRDKFRPDWIPEAMPELKDEDIQELMEGTEDLPAIWVISERFQPCAPSSIEIDVSGS